MNEVGQIIFYGQVFVLHIEYIAIFFISAKKMFLIVFFLNMWSISVVFLHLLGIGRRNISPSLLEENKCNDKWSLIYSCRSAVYKAIGNGEEWWLPRLYMSHLMGTASVHSGHRKIWHQYYLIFRFFNKRYKCGIYVKYPTFQMLVAFKKYV